MIQILISAIVVLFSVTLIGWLYASAAVEGRSTSDGMSHLEFTPAMHVYGGLMGSVALGSVLGFGSMAFTGPTTGAFLGVVCAGVFMMSFWALYAGYGGRLSYSSDGIFYHGLRAKRFANWDEISAVRDGDFAQHILIEHKPYVLSKGLRGFQNFVNEARLRGAKVDDTLIQ